MSYSEFLERCYENENNRSEDLLFQFAAVRFIEEVKGTEHRYCYYKNATEFLMLCATTAYEINDLIEDECERQELIKLIEQSFKETSDLTKSAIELIEKEFSSCFLAEFEYADDILKEELIEYFEKIARAHRQQEVIRSVEPVSAAG
ncbi:hypothetical protein [Vibrio crassostreae]|uniref:hypothetical protein n=1 Tax=Vibrio crassostreae TaxID=246167 RepID=UPI000F49AEFA|nr:hypothetical protein [Vibrio crassostreae]ROS70692.1 hypothetical protein EDB73_101368 [Vibrio crassostreae]